MTDVDVDDGGGDMGIPVAKDGVSMSMCLYGDVFDEYDVTCSCDAGAALCVSCLLFTL